METVVHGLRVKHGEAYMLPHCPICGINLCAHNLTPYIDTKTGNIARCVCGILIGIKNVRWEKVYVCIIEC